MIRELTSETFQEVIASDMPVLVDFWAPWCGPCRMVGPFIEKLAETYEGKAIVCKMNVDDSPDIAMSYKVSSVPAVFLFKNGEVLQKAIGARPAKFYDQMLAEQVQD